MIKIRRPSDIISMCREGKSAVNDDTNTVNLRGRYDNSYQWIMKDLWSQL